MKAPPKNTLILGLVILVAAGAWFFLLPTTSDNVAGIALTAYYTDGSSHTYNPSQPLSIIDVSTGKTISRIDYAVTALISWTAAGGVTKTGHTITGVVDINDGPKGTTSISIQKEIAINNPSSLSSGVSQVIASGSITQADILTYYNKNPSSTHSLIILTHVDAVINFSDGTTGTKSAEAQGQIDYSYATGTVTQLLVTVGLTPFQ